MSLTDERRLRELTTLRADLARRLRRKRLCDELFTAGDLRDRNYLRQDYRYVSTWDGPQAGRAIVGAMHRGYELGLRKAAAVDAAVPS